MTSFAHRARVAIVPASWETAFGVNQPLAALIVGPGHFQGLSPARDGPPTGTPPVANGCRRFVADRTGQLLFDQQTGAAFTAEDPAPRLGNGGIGPGSDGDHGVAEEAEGPSTASQSRWAVRAEQEFDAVGVHPYPLSGPGRAAVPGVSCTDFEKGRLQDLPAHHAQHREPVKASRWPRYRVPLPVRLSGHLEGRGSVREGLATGGKASCRSCPVRP